MGRMKELAIEKAWRAEVRTRLDNYVIFAVGCLTEYDDGESLICLPQGTVIDGAQYDDNLPCISVIDLLEYFSPEFDEVTEIYRADRGFLDEFEAAPCSAEVHGRAGFTPEEGAALSVWERELMERFDE